MSKNKPILLDVSLRYFLTAKTTTNCLTQWQELYLWFISRNQSFSELPLVSKVSLKFVWGYFFPGKTLKNQHVHSHNLFADAVLTCLSAQPNLLDLMTSAPETKPPNQ
jgi:hypothetical protein